ncbi:MAG: hypothetical protein JRN52_01735 [Nitrososphaerota archaeon]|nr:hypothetical protein [Nitrososphaerota archaeon]
MSNYGECFAGGLFAPRPAFGKISGRELALLTTCVRAAWTEQLRRAHETWAITLANAPAQLYASGICCWIVPF